MNPDELKDLQEITTRAVNSAFGLVGAVCAIIEKVGNDGERPRDASSEDKH